MGKYAPPFQLNADVVNLLAEVCELVGQVEVSHRDSMSVQLRRQNLIRSVHSSLFIEQNTLTLEQVTAVLDGELPHSKIENRLSSDQVPTKLPAVAQEAVSALLKALGKDTVSAAELMKRMKMVHRPHFREFYLNPALESGLVERTIPDKPNSPRQRYRATH